jgi:hypothetical protein
MSATARVIPLERPAPDLDGLTTKARIGAYLFKNGWLDFHRAVDGIQHYADRTGLVREIGQDAVQEVIAAAFGSIAREIDEGTYE